PLTLSVPPTGAPPALNVTVPLTTLATLTGALNCTSTRPFTGTPTAPLTGLTPTTVGAVVTAPNPVVKFELKYEGVCPSRSVMPYVAFTQYIVSVCNGCAGVSVAISPSALTAMLPAIGIPVSCG